jgi:hypothetical protein
VPNDSVPLDDILVAVRVAEPGEEVGDIYIPFVGNNIGQFEG